MWTSLNEATGAGKGLFGRARACPARPLFALLFGRRAGGEKIELHRRDFLDGDGRADALRLRAEHDRAGLPPPLPPNFMARTPNSSGLKKMYQGNSAQISPSVTPSAATVRSLRRSRFAGGRLGGEGDRLALATERREGGAAGASPARRLLAASSFSRTISSSSRSALRRSGIRLLPRFQMAGEIGEGVGGRAVARRLRHRLVDQRHLPAPRRRARRRRRAGRRRAGGCRACPRSARSSTSAS